LQFRSKKKGTHKVLSKWDCTFRTQMDLTTETLNGGKKVSGAKQSDGSNGVFC